MSDISSIVVCDAKIARVLDFHQADAAAELFELYRVSGSNRDAFVAALIARICTEHQRSANISRRGT